MMDRLAELKKEESSVIRHLESVRNEIRQIKLQQLGLNVGDVVISTGVSHIGKTVKVTSIDLTFSEPWVSGQMKKKDGSWGREINLYSHWRKE